MCERMTQMYSKKNLHTHMHLSGAILTIEKQFNKSVALLNKNDRKTKNIYTYIYFEYWECALINTKTKADIYIYLHKYVYELNTIYVFYGRCMRVPICICIWRTITLKSCMYSQRETTVREKRNGNARVQTKWASVVAFEITGTRITTTKTITAIKTTETTTIFGSCKF